MHDADLQKLRIDKAVEVAVENAWIDGEHHKMWVINEMLRALIPDDYDALFAADENWDQGIPP